ncbi:hypothetical protein [Pseudoponticoccus marisrubri]|uniref:Uncharacterized protein n=1 Tax=Pseudoponticoccus marisrubri TaxID=1685382 RepID=A0A0W7WMG6_9RHOB|nr:hypothetical protein [Pseudoponticoccus marisrubri]KUF11781.1 hypothetical protein AVJ23_04135 [Pseudoponticoccus marisrubri]
MPQSQSQYFFGNSLVTFAEGGAQTNVPVWMDRMAEADGNSYAASGSFGFLRSFADQPAPADQWGFAGVDPAWDSGAESFAEAEFDTVLITPANFIQDQAPTADYAQDSRSPLEATLDIVGDVTAAQPAAQVLIYEGWADLGPFGDFPPSDADLAEYHAFNSGPYHDWYVALVEAVNTADPDADAQLLPVGSILSEVMTTTLADLPVEVFFVDSAPHGTETTYYLAAMITYQGSYGSPPPLPADLPDTIHPAVAERYDEINAVITSGLEEAGFEISAAGSVSEAGATEASDEAEEPDDEAPDTAADTEAPDPDPEPDDAAETPEQGSGSEADTPEPLPNDVPEGAGTPDPVTPDPAPSEDLEEVSSPPLADDPTEETPAQETPAPADPEPAAQSAPQDPETDESPAETPMTPVAEEPAAQIPEAGSDPFDDAADMVAAIGFGPPQAASALGDFGSTPTDLQALQTALPPGLQEVAAPYLDRTGDGLPDHFPARVDDLSGPLGETGREILAALTLPDPPEDPDEDEPEIEVPPFL